MAKLLDGWRNRIVGTGEESPDQLLANPLNFRIHSGAQQQALTGSLDTLGWVQTVLVNKNTGHVIDGHLRVALALRTNQPLVPVTYVELTEEEEAQALLSLDPIAAMAATDKNKMDELLRAVQTDDENVMKFLEDLAEREGVIGISPDKWSDAMDALPDEDKAPFQQMTFTLHDSQAEKVKMAVKLALDVGVFDGSPNENSNGNALAFICEAFIDGRS